MTACPSVHVPVLRDQVIALLAPRDGGVYVDGTFGAGGYTRALLAAADCRVLGIDRDPAAVARGEALAATHGDRFAILEGRFGDMEDLLAARGVHAVDGVALDLGVSSAQLDDPARGFSFRFDGPLDMRMGPDGPSAAELVNTCEEKDLAKLIFELGEERLARKVARAIAAARREAPIETTGRLAEIVRRVVPRGRDGIDPATRTFQALRIHVNDELGELERGLAAAERLLRPGGRLVVVAFHSLEDRRVKEFLQRRAGRRDGGSRHRPQPNRPAPTFRLLTRKPITPDAAEIAANPRAASAKLRAAERIEAPARPGGAAP